MAFCAQCGTQVADGAVFCGVCGSPIAGGGGSSTAGPAGDSSWSGTSNSQTGADAGYAYSSGATGGLPPSPPLWDFQKSVIPFGEQIVSAVGLSQAKTGIGGIFARIIRSTFLDPRVAREQALNEAGTNDAVIALVILSVPAMLLGLLTTLAFRFGMVSAVVSFVISIVMAFVSVFILSILTKPILGVGITFPQLLRATTYAQGARLLAFIPVLGALLGLWSFVSMLAAIREITAAETGKLIVFIVVAIVVSVVAGIVVGLLSAPLLLLLR